MSSLALASGLAFVFDLDGVVIDSMPLHTEAWRRYLERYGITADELVARMHGRRNDEIVSAFFGAELSPEEIFGHGSAKEALFREMMRPALTAHLVPGVSKFLDRWNAVPTGLASNAEPANIEFVLGEAGIRIYFDAIVDGHQVERPKPFPDIYLRAAEQLGAAPGNCIVFEDSPTGIAAAQSAGMRVVGVQTHTGELPPVELLIRDFEAPALESWLLIRQVQA